MAQILPPMATTLPSNDTQFHPSDSSTVDQISGSCCICCFAFDNDVRRPQELLCGHVMCTQCHNQLLSHNYNDVSKVCPFHSPAAESEDTTLSLDSLSSTVFDVLSEVLPLPEVYAAEPIEIDSEESSNSTPSSRPLSMASTSSYPPPSPPECDLCQASAVVWCVQCEQHFCEDDARRHNKMRVSKHHQTLPSADVEGDPCLKRAPRTCSIHQQPFFCYDMQCSVLLCSSCVSEHSGHNCVAIGDIEQCAREKAANDALRAVAVHFLQEKLGWKSDSS